MRQIQSVSAFRSKFCRCERCEDCCSGLMVRNCEAFSRRPKVLNSSPEIPSRSVRVQPAGVLLGTEGRGLQFSVFTACRRRLVSQSEVWPEPEVVGSVHSRDQSLGLQQLEEVCRRPQCKSCGGWPVGRFNTGGEQYCFRFSTVSHPEGMRKLQQKPREVRCCAQSPMSMSMLKNGSATPNILEQRTRQRKRRTADTTISVEDFAGQSASARVSLAASETMPTKQ